MSGPGDAPASTVRAIGADDKAAWLGLWADYCAFYRAELPAATTGVTWSRLLDPGMPMHGLVAEKAGGVVGFALYVLHPFSWGEQPVCYLEDLFVAPEARGRGIGGALIESLIALGREARWARVYWMTEETNDAARRLYDRYTPRDAFVRYLVKL